MWCDLKGLCLLIELVNWSIGSWNKLNCVHVIHVACSAGANGLVVYRSYHNVLRGVPVRILCAPHRVCHILYSSPDIDCDIPGVSSPLHQCCPLSPADPERARVNALLLIWIAERRKVRWEKRTARRNILQVLLTKWKPFFRNFLPGIIYKNLGIYKCLSRAYICGTP